MKGYLIICCLLVVGSLLAQTNVGLRAHYQFEGDLSDATGNTSNAGAPSGIIDYGCGVSGDALRLDGSNDFMRVLSNDVNGEFNTEDFSIGFYFKPIGNSGTQFLVSKRDTACSIENYFFIRYIPVTRSINVVLRNGAQQAVLNHQLANRMCWQHIALVRRDRRVRLYVNGEQVADQGTTSRVDLSNSGSLQIGGSNCRMNNETTFQGLIDDFRLYNRALRDEEAIDLYTAPDQIVTPDARIFLGESVNIELASSCGTSFSWRPATGVQQISDAMPTITPAGAGDNVYRVLIRDMESNCTVEDSIRIQVIDPSTLDCSQVFLPRAFTPNGNGPTVNESFGISNPFAVPELISFEVFDRWGSRVFFTSDAFDRWNGDFAGQPVNSGVFLYRVRYVCQGEEQLQSGSVTVLR